MGNCLFGFDTVTKACLNKLNVISCNSLLYFAFFYNLYDFDHLYKNILIINSSILFLYKSEISVVVFQNCYADALSTVPLINATDKLEKYDYYIDYCKTADIKTTVTKHLSECNLGHFNTFHLFTLISIYLN